MTTAADRRRNQILELLERQGRVDVRALSSELAVPASSLHKDLMTLEELGLLKCVQDGAVALPHYRLGENRSRKMSLNREKKERIGRAAAGLIRAGESLILDSGTTSLYVSRQICSDIHRTGDLTVYTASLPILRELGNCPGVRLILLGGIYQAEDEALAGPQTVKNLREIHVDKTFLGADGISLSNGITTVGIFEADADRNMLEASREVIVVADSSKIGVIGLVSLAPLDRVNTLVTDAEAPHEFVDAVRTLGVKVILA